MTIHKTVRDLAIKHQINIARNEHGYYFLCHPIWEGGGLGQAIPWQVSTNPSGTCRGGCTAKSGIELIKRAIKARRL